MFANHGALIKHEHIIEGINSRLDGIQVAILNVKLKYISEWTHKRIKISNIYNKYLKHLNMKLQYQKLMKMRSMYFTCM